MDEELSVRLRFVVALVGDGVLNLVVLSADPRVHLVAIRMQLCESLQPSLRLTVGDEPAAPTRQVMQVEVEW